MLRPTSSLAAERPACSAELAHPEVLRQQILPTHKFLWCGTAERFRIGGLRCHRISTNSSSGVLRSGYRQGLPDYLETSNGLLQYTAEEVGRAVELSLRQALAERSSLLKSAMFSLSILKDEMQKNTTYTLPFISLTVFLLVSFTIGSWYEPLKY